MRDEGSFPVGMVCRWAGPHFMFVASVFLSCWEQAGRNLCQEKKRGKEGETAEEREGERDSKTQFFAIFSCEKNFQHIGIVSMGYCVTVLKFSNYK